MNLRLVIILSLILLFTGITNARADTDIETYPYIYQKTGGGTENSLTLEVESAYGTRQAGLS